MRPPLRRAAILAVGSELLTPQRTDTNSLHITDQLNRLGIDVVLKMIVGDDRDELAEAFRTARRRADLIVLSGGLGPTDDDVTRDVVAAALGRTLAEEPGDHRTDPRAVHRPRHHDRHAGDQPSPGDGPRRGDGADEYARQRPWTVARGR
jgi:molybdopterin-biosynthesis enzyme MoeA-like protein